MAEKWQDERNEEKRKYWFLISRNDSLKTRSKREETKKTKTKTQKLKCAIEVERRKIPHDEGG